MERPRGLEPPPTAWQAVVLPLYYGRPAGKIIYNTPLGTRQGPHLTRGAARGHEPSARRAGSKDSAWLIDFEDPGSADDRRFLLPLGKPNSPLSIDIHPGKLFAVVVIDGDLPVPMLAAFVVAESASPAHSLLVLSLILLFLFHVCIPQRLCTIAIRPAFCKYQVRE